MQIIGINGSDFAHVQQSDRQDNRLYPLVDLYTKRQKLEVQIPDLELELDVHETVLRELVIFNVGLVAPADNFDAVGVSNALHFHIRHSECLE